MTNDPCPSDKVAGATVMYPTFMDNYDFVDPVTFTTFWGHTGIQLVQAQNLSGTATKMYSNIYVRRPYTRERSSNKSILTPF